MESTIPSDAFAEPALRLALILGSSREGRFCDRVARWARKELSALPEWQLDLIDPVELDLPAHHERSDGDSVLALAERLHAADAFIVITPEYNHGYPAVLKHLIDSVYAPWAAKPVGFISYGGVSGGARAVEQLRQVFAELHATTVRDSVSFNNVWDQFSAEGRLWAPEQARRSLATLLDRLRWWALALREARRTRPYQRKPNQEPAQPAPAAILYNVFTPKDGKLDELIEAQTRALQTFGAQIDGWRGGRLHRSLDGRTALMVTAFDSEEHHRRWIESEQFAEHRARILDIVESAERGYYRLVYQTGAV